MLIGKALLFIMLLDRLKSTSQSDLLSVANLFYYCYYGVVAHTGIKQRYNTTHS